MSQCTFSFLLLRGCRLYDEDGLYQEYNAGGLKKLDGVRHGAL